MCRLNYVAYTWFNGNVCNKKWSLASAVQFIQQSNKSNNGSTCTTVSTCNTRAVIKITGSMAACIAAMTVHSSGSTVNHLYDAYDTSNYHTTHSFNKLVIVGGGTTSQAIFNGAMCLTVAISAVCLVLMTGVVQSVYDTGLR